LIEFTAKLFQELRRFIEFSFLYNITYLVFTMFYIISLITFV